MRMRIWWCMNSGQNTLTVTDSAHAHWLLCPARFWAAAHASPHTLRVSAAWHLQRSSPVSSQCAKKKNITKKQDVVILLYMCWWWDRAARRRVGERWEKGWDHCRHCPDQPFLVRSSSFTPLSHTENHSILQRSLRQLQLDDFSCRANVVSFTGKQSSFMSSYLCVFAHKILVQIVCRKQLERISPHVSTFYQISEWILW